MQPLQLMDQQLEHIKLEHLLGLLQIILVYHIHLTELSD